MNPAVDKDDPTYVQMHSAIGQGDTIRDSVTIPPCNSTVNGIGTRTYTNSPSIGKYLLMVC